MSAVFKLRNESGVWTQVSSIQGPTGPAGVGISGVSSAVQDDGSTRVTLTMTDGSSYSFDVSRGEKGDSGASSSLAGKSYDLSISGTFFRLMVDMAVALGATVTGYLSDVDAIGSLASSILGSYSDSDTIGALQTAKGLPDESTLGSLL